MHPCFPRTKHFSPHPIIHIDKLILIVRFANLLHCTYLPFTDTRTRTRIQYMCIGALVNSTARPDMIALCPSSTQAEPVQIEVHDFHEFCLALTPPPPSLSIGHLFLANKNALRSASPLCVSYSLHLAINALKSSPGTIVVILFTPHTLG